MYLKIQSFEDDYRMETASTQKLLDALTGIVLDMFIKHEIHHRGQLTVLMRQAGLPATGVYGPSKEEWTQAVT